MKTYEGDRIFLKKIQISELSDSVMDWFNDDSLMKYYTSSKNAITREKLIDSINLGEQTESVYTFGIYLKDTSKLIGTVKLGPISKAHKTSDLATLIGDKDYHGKGLAVEAIQLGNKLAFEEFDIRKLYGGVYEDNIASYKAYTKAGWVTEGVLKGQYLHDGQVQDRILIACFNPKYFTV